MPDNRDPMAQNSLRDVFNSSEQCNNRIPAPCSNPVLSIYQYLKSGYGIRALAPSGVTVSESAQVLG